MKRLIAVLLSAILVVSLAACGGSGTPSSSPAGEPGSTAGSSAPGGTAADGKPAHKEELIIGAAADINSLDLQQQSDQINNICLKLTHQTLFDLDQEGNRVPGLATEATWLDDNTLQIKLRGNVKFSDGSP